MANNRLYLYDPVSNTKILLAKTLGGWWAWHADSTALDQWLRGKDEPASLGNCTEPTRLMLLDEHTEEDRNL